MLLILQLLPLLGSLSILVTLGTPACLETRHHFDEASGAAPRRGAKVRS